MFWWRKRWRLVAWQWYWPAWWRVWPHVWKDADYDYDLTYLWVCIGALQLRFARRSTARDTGAPMGGTFAPPVWYREA